MNCWEDGEAQVLVADEAHRTAGLRRRKGRGSQEAEKIIKDFTLCHSDSHFPAKYRVYQTATPRIFDGSKAEKDADLIVRQMDDETIFGVEMFRRNHTTAVDNGWLADYRIIAIGVNDRAMPTTRPTSWLWSPKGAGNVLAPRTRCGAWPSPWPWAEPRRTFMARMSTSSLASLSPTAWLSRGTWKGVCSLSPFDSGCKIGWTATPMDARRRGIGSGT